MKAMELNGWVIAARSFILFENEAAVVGYRFDAQRLTPIQLQLPHSPSIVFNKTN